jgi:hypothetical protein
MRLRRAGLRDGVTQPLLADRVAATAGVCRDSQTYYLRLLKAPAMLAAPKPRPLQLRRFASRIACDNHRYSR